MGYLCFFSSSEQETYSFIVSHTRSDTTINETANEEKSPFSNSQSNDYTFCFSYISLLFTCLIRFPLRSRVRILVCVSCWWFFFTLSHDFFQQRAKKEKTPLTPKERKTSQHRHMRFWKIGSQNILCLYLSRTLSISHPSFHLCT